MTKLPMLRWLLIFLRFIGAAVMGYYIITGGDSNYGMPGVILIVCGLWLAVDWLTDERRP